MNESRVCPVCENEIPEEARFLCPHCHFELKWMDDELAIQNARQNFTNNVIFKDKPEDAIERPVRKYFVSGLLGSAIPGFLMLVLFFWSLGILLWAYALPVWLFGGLPAGFIGTMLENRFSGSPVLIVLTFILGFIFAFLMDLAIVSSL